MKKIAKSCRPLISEGRFRNHGADIMLMKCSSVAKSRIGTLSKLQVPVKCTDQKAQDLKKEGVCESQRRARAKKRAYNDDPKAAAAEDFPKRQMIEMHVQRKTQYLHGVVRSWHSPFSWEAAAPSGMDAAFVRRSRSCLLFPLAPCSCRLSNGHTERLHRSALAPTSGTS